MRINPGLPRRIAPDDKPVAEFAVATFMSEYWRNLSLTLQIYLYQIVGYSHFYYCNDLVTISGYVFQSTTGLTFQYPTICKFNHSSSHYKVAEPLLIKNNIPISMILLIVA